MISQSNSQVNTGRYEDQDTEKYRDSIRHKYVIPNRYMDTVWVVDSIREYKIYNNLSNLERERTYRVISRDSYGNIQSALSIFNNLFPGEVGNTYFDSTIYFPSYEQKEYYRKDWNSTGQEWMQTRYIEHLENGDIKENMYLDYSDFDNQVLYGEWSVGKTTNNRIDTLYYYFYLTGSGMWDLTHKIELFYNDEGKDTLNLIYVFDDDQWHYSVKIRQEYPSDSIENYFNFLYNPQESVWRNNIIRKILYNSNGQRSIYSSKYWSVFSEEWFLTDSSRYTYDQQGRLESRLIIKYNHNSQQIENDSYYEYQYTENSTTLIGYQWNSYAESWDNFNYEFTSYIAEDKADTVYTAYWSQTLDNWEVFAMDVTEYDERLNTTRYTRYIKEWTGLLLQQSRDVYYWSPFNPSSIDENKEPRLLVYPNPATEVVTFSIIDHLQFQNTEETYLDIYELSGRKISQKLIINGKTQWNCASQKPGIYIYSMIVGGELVIGKVILQQ